MCDYCAELPEPLRAIYDKYVDIAGESAMEFGPAHIVWGDFNMDRGSVQWCLDNFEAYSKGHDAEALAAVRASLEELLALDLEALEAARPDIGYDEDLED